MGNEKLHLPGGRSLLHVVVQVLTRRIRRLERENEEIPKLRAQIAQLQAEVTRDGLTGLVPRKFALEMASSALATAMHAGRSFSALFIDIDHFKQVNDTRGHEAGDEALRTISTLLLANVRKGDVVCRWGGEEIVIFLPEADEDGATARAQELLASMRDCPIKDERYSEDFFVTASIGVATYQEDESLSQLVNRADKAMYGAKNGGRNRVQTWSEEMTTIAAE